jgi:hypothetical protein
MFFHGNDQRTAAAHSDQNCVAAAHIRPKDSCDAPVYAAMRGLTGSRSTIRSVQIGPRNKEANHQPNPLLPLLCAKPALMSESVNQPTAYCPVE